MSEVSVVYCDNGGETIPNNAGTWIGELVVAVESANVGESAVLCEDCYDDYRERASADNNVRRIDNDEKGTIMAHIHAQQVNVEANRLIEKIANMGGTILQYSARGADGYGVVLWTRVRNVEYDVIEYVTHKWSYDAERDVVDCWWGHYMTDRAEALRDYDIRRSS